MALRVTASLTASATLTSPPEGTPATLRATQDRGCPSTFAEVATDDEHAARNEADTLEALAILASLGKTRACVYSTDEDSPTDTLGSGGPTVNR